MTGGTTTVADIIKYLKTDSFANTCTKLYYRTVDW